MFIPCWGIVIVFVLIVAFISIIVFEIDALAGKVKEMKERVEKLALANSVIETETDNLSGRVDKLEEQVEKNATDWRA